MMPPMKTLDQAAFARWLAAYPRPLERDIFGAAEPPLVTWNDFVRAPYWPDSVVASAVGNVYRVIVDPDAPVITSCVADTRPLTDSRGRPVQVGDRVAVVWGGFSAARHHTVLKHDIGTPYERWGISDCANDLRSLSFVRLDPEEPA